MTEMSKACDSFNFDGHTILVGSDDIGYNQSIFMRSDNESIFILGFQIIKFSIQDRNIDLISLIGTIMIQTAMAIGEKHTYFIPD